MSKLGIKYNSVPSVTSDGKTFKDYSTNADKYTITINQVTGDLVITATAARTACLAKGTKILLANGKYKNIENIRYDDLLMVYNHENGTFTPEYPIWIEKGNLSSNYQVITFSDGTSLTTIDKHSLFSVDDNRYVDVTDENTFHVGTNILKTVKSKRGYKLKSVSVTNIEKVIIFSKTGSSKKAITSLKFIKNLKHLKVFQTDYIIKDGDLTPLMNLNDTCILTWRKYYNMKDKDLPHESVVYRVDNLRGITKKLTEIENGKENKNIIWFDEL